MLVACLQGRSNVQYDFDWDQQKARSNYLKHGVRFDQAITVFRDPRALSIYDEEHSREEDRWVTVGLSARGGVVVVHHTFEERDSTIDLRINKGILSPRRQERKERKTA